jgi:outer membrane immunogenic protein
MRRLSLVLLATAACSQFAVAADLPVKAQLQAPAMAAAYNWTGLYIGAHVGAGWGNEHFVDTTEAPFLDEGSHEVSGGLIGGQIGYNLQMGSMVFGVEAQGSFAELTGSHVSLAFDTDRLSTRVDRLGAFTGRIGVAWDRSLLYARGGAAVAHARYSSTDIPLGVTYANHEQTRWGWLAGGGLEYGLGGNWSANIEYNYMDFRTGRSTNVVCNPNLCLPTGMFNEDVTQRLHVVKGGFNYRFEGFR